MVVASLVFNNSSNIMKRVSAGNTFLKNTSCFSSYLIVWWSSKTPSSRYWLNICHECYHPQPWSRGKQHQLKDKSPEPYILQQPNWLWKEKASLCNYPCLCLPKTLQMDNNCHILPYSGQCISPLLFSPLHCFFWGTTVQ